MHTFSIAFFTANRQCRMDFSGAKDEDLRAFFGLFGTVEDGRIQTEGIQRASAGLKAAVAAYCAARKAQIPQVGAFKKLIDDLALDEAFLVLPAAPRSSAEIAMLEMLVAWANGTISVEDAVNHQRFFAPTLAEYNLVHPATDRPNTIGNAQKAQRRCRFCGKTKADDAKFAGRAHAISFGLGNVHLKLADECDDCNGFFGRELEPHLIAFLDIQRVFLGTRGRGGDGGLPHVKLRGGTMRHDGERIIIEIVADAVGREDNAFSFEIESDVAVIPELCYRTMAKFVLSVLPETELVRLKAAVEWVRYGTRPAGRTLPVVFENIVPLEPNPSAQVAAYVRKSEHSDLPHIVGEFRLGCFVYVFIMPFSDADVGESAFFGSKRFNETFPHYTGVPGWRERDFSSTDPIEGAGIMRFVHGNEQNITRTVSG